MYELVADFRSPMLWSWIYCIFPFFLLLYRISCDACVSRIVVPAHFVYYLPEIRQINGFELHELHAMLLTMQCVAE